MSLFELRFRHAARGPTRPAQALIRRDVTFFESSGGSNVVAAPQSARTRAGEVRRAFLQAVAHRGGVNLQNCPTEPASKIRRAAIRIKPPQVG